MEAAERALAGVYDRVVLSPTVLLDLPIAGVFSVYDGGGRQARLHQGLCCVGGVMLCCGPAPKVPLHWRIGGDSESEQVRALCLA